MHDEKEILISQFIDNELNLDEKIEFVQEVRQSEDFTSEALEMLEQEKLLEKAYNTPAPSLPKAKQKPKVIKVSFANTASLTALAASLLLVVKVFFLTPETMPDNKELHRFVLHMPGAENVSVAGSFSAWQNIKMQQAGGSGYWQVSLPLSEGEHTYSFIVDGKEQMADPTVSARQMDDFGGENSILKVGDKV